MRLRGLVVMTALVLGCGGGGGGNGTTEPPAYSSLAVTPSGASLFSAAPGNTVALTATPIDQSGHPIAGLGAATLSSSDLTKARSMRAPEWSPQSPRVGR